MRTEKIVSDKYICFRVSVFGRLHPSFLLNPSSYDVSVIVSDVCASYIRSGIVRVTVCVRISNLTRWPASRVRSARGEVLENSRTILRT